MVLTAVFLYVILGVTDTRAPKGFAPLAIGLSLTLIHLISIPVTNTSVNPAARSGRKADPCSAQGPQGVIERLRRTHHRVRLLRAGSVVPPEVDR